MALYVLVNFLGYFYLLEYTLVVAGSQAFQPPISQVANYLAKACPYGTGFRQLAQRSFRKVIPGMIFLGYSEVLTRIILQAVLAYQGCLLVVE